MHRCGCVAGRLLWSPGSLSAHRGTTVHMFGSLRLWAYTCVRVGPVRTRMCMPGCVGTRAGLTLHALTRKLHQGKRLGSKAGEGGKCRGQRGGRRGGEEGQVAPLGISLVGPNRRRSGDLQGRPSRGGGAGRSALRHRCALAHTGGHTQAHTHCRDPGGPARCGTSGRRPLRHRRAVTSPDPPPRPRVAPSPLMAGSAELHICLVGN